MSKDDKKTDTPRMVHNYMTGEQDAPPLPGKIAEMVNLAMINGYYLLVGEIRYAVAGHPSQVTDDYIFFDKGCIEVARTGELGGEPEDAEVLPFPKIMLMDSVCWIEHIEIKKLKPSLKSNK